MLDQKYYKPLYQLASEQALKNGENRSLVLKVDPGYSLYSLLTVEDKAEMTEKSILPFFFGDEVGLLEEKCLSPYWFWKVVKESVVISLRNEISIEKTLSRIRASVVFPPTSETEAIAYGFMLWDSRLKLVVKNPIFNLGDINEN